jgi:predicted short-subunit dehydrogenase-like oxidoreductase (DUF2520 family)
MTHREKILCARSSRISGVSRVRRAQRIKRQDPSWRTVRGGVRRLSIALGTESTPGVRYPAWWTGTSQAGRMSQTQSPHPAPHPARHPAPQPARHPARLRVGVVGTGRVGAVLGAALKAAGHDVTGAYGVSEASRTRAEALLPDVPLLTPEEVITRCDLALIAVPDAVLPSLIAGLASNGAFRTGQLVAHPSGRYGVAVLDPATRKGGLPLALHPAMTFTGTSIDLKRLHGASFGVTAPAVLRPIAEALVVEMGGEPVWVEESHRALYHAALAHGANHLVTLVTETLDLLRAAGIEDPAKAVGPLLVAALDNTLESGDDALTGPVARGDAETVAEHVRQIAAVSPHSADVYVPLARVTALRALATGRLRAHEAEGLLEVLADRQDGAHA